MILNLYNILIISTAVVISKFKKMFYFEYLPHALIPATNLEIEFIETARLEENILGTFLIGNNIDDVNEKMSILMNIRTRISIAKTNKIFYFILIRRKIILFPERWFL